MQVCTVYHDICSGCGGSGQQPLAPVDGSQECQMCDGTGKQVYGTVEMDVPTAAQFTAKFNDIADALQAIWNKVKDLP